MNQEIFADAISAIHVTGQLVRIDLMTVQPQLKSDNGQPVVDISKRIIMPLEGFIQSLNVQDNLVTQLVAAGVLKKKTDLENEVAQPDDSPAEATAASVGAAEVAAAQPDDSQAEVAAALACAAENEAAPAVEAVGI
ncbi:hypothetical protein Ga0466249_002070 [Sporomusaceae bacterium BoRhaA]|uniref:hypothetical protein n=1 Tax=Pelorhabdus rhamnosifermentans TaxID=2772457 RepID=UPI001C06227C|nr:hypothetical protein [Pelorhabdus rhamnosifermentans]MBU2700959.1 hypothetical protein [Pelorhabdus rhamnosifermentans]